MDRTGMEQSHVKPAARFDVRALWTPSPAAQHGIRFGIATAAAIWLGYAMGFPQPTWPVITVMMIAQPSAGASVQKSMLRICGTMLAGVISIGIFGLVGQDHLLLAVSVSAVFGLGVYGMTGPRHGYAWNVMGFTSGIILGDAYAGASDVENVAFDRVTLVALGVFAGLIAEAIFWPTRTEPALRASLEQRFSAVTNLFDETRATRRGVPPATDDSNAPDPTVLLNDLTLLDQLRMQLGVGPKRVRAFAQVSLGLQALEGAARSLASAATGHEGTSAPPEQDPVDDVLAEAGRTLADVADALATDRRPSTRVESLTNALHAFEDTHTSQLADVSLVAAPGRSSDDLERDKRVVSDQSIAAPILQRVVSLVGGMANAVDAIVADEPENGSLLAPGQAHDPRPRFTIDPLRVELALRGAIAVGAVFVVMPLMGWQVSSTPMILAFMIAALPTRTAMGQTVIGVGVAVLAAAILADLSIMYVVPHLGRSPMALLYPFVIAGGAGYVAVAVPKLAPIAPTFALITILSVFGGSRPPDNVAGPYLTVWTISVGIVIGMAAQRLLWPRTAAELFRIRVAQQIDLCLDTLKRSTKNESGDDRSRSLAVTLARQSQSTALITQLNAQAHEEEAGAGLDDTSRAALISGVTELLDTTVQIGALSEVEAPVGQTTVQRDVDALTTTLRGLEEVVISSLAASMRSLEHDVPLVVTGLSDAVAAATSQVVAIHGRPDHADSRGTNQLGAWIARIEGIKRLASCALSIEDWVHDWQQAKESAA